MLAIALLLAPVEAPGYERVKPPIAFAVGNDRRSPYRFKVTNWGWNERKDVVLEVFQGKKRLAFVNWKEGFPNVYAAKARRQGRSEDILVTATCDGRLTQHTGAWLFSTRTKHLKPLAKSIDNADDSRLARGIVKEQGVDRWLFDPPRGDSPDDWYHRTWIYDAKVRRLVPGPWHPE